MKADKNIILYREKEKLLVAEVKKGQSYFLPLDGSVKVFNGSIFDFLKDKKDYEFLN